MLLIFATVCALLCNFCDNTWYLSIYKGKVIIYRISSIPISKWSKIKVNFRSLTLWGVSTGVVKSFFFVPAWQLGSILQLLQQILGHFRGFWAAAASSVGLMIVFGIQVEVSGNQGPTAFRCKVHTRVLKKDNTNEFLRGCELIGENLGLYQLMISHSSSEKIHPVQSVTTFIPTSNPNR